MLIPSHAHVQDQGQRKRKDEAQDDGEAGINDGVADRNPVGLVLEEHLLEVVQADELWRLDDVVFGKGEAQGAEDRVRGKDEERDQPGQDEEEPRARFPAAEGAGLTLSFGQRVCHGWSPLELVRCLGCTLHSPVGGEGSSRPRPVY
jgi:hypothetical protein